MSTKITRYMSFASFVSFLKNGIFVPQAAKFSDKWEGLLPLSKIQEDHHEDYQGMRDLLSPFTYISCWHSSVHESYAMWKVYGRISEAVAIETTIEKLQAAYKTSYPSTLAYLGDVKYVDTNTPNKVELPKGMKTICKPPADVAGGAYFPIMLFYYLKHIGYEYEKEVRLVALDESFDDEKENTNDGIYIDHTRVENFLSSVRIFPESSGWFKEVVNDVLVKYGQEVTVYDSTLNGPQYNRG